MGTPFMGELRIMSFNFAPKGWAFCNGQFLPINQNQALFSLLGTTYGGNGQTTFALPDLRGRAPIHSAAASPGRGRRPGGAHADQSEMPAHNHFVKRHRQRRPAPNRRSGSMLVAGDGEQRLRAADQPDDDAPARSATSAAASRTRTGSRISVLNFIIALQGIFPSQN